MATQNITDGAQIGTPNDTDTVNLFPGNTALVTNIDWSGVAAMANLFWSAGFTGRLGTASSPFKARISTLFEFSGMAGEVWWNSLGSGSDVSALLQLNGEGHVHLVDGTITRVDQHGGRLTIGAAGVVPTLNLFAGSATYEDDAGTSPNTINQWGGHLVIERAIATTFNHYGGTAIIDTSDNLGTINVHAPGLKIKDCGDISALNAYYVPDLSELVRAITITATVYNRMRPDLAQLLSNTKITNSAPVPYFGA